MRSSDDRPLDFTIGRDLRAEISASTSVDLEPPIATQPHARLASAVVTASSNVEFMGLMLRTKYQPFAREDRRRGAPVGVASGAPPMHE